MTQQFRKPIPNSASMAEDKPQIQPNQHNEIGQLDPPVPANDNIDDRPIRYDSVTVRHFARSPYQPAATKMWWLP